MLYLVVGTILAADDYVHVSPTNEDLHTAILSGNFKSFIKTLCVILLIQRFYRK